MQSRIYLLVGVLWAAFLFSEETYVPLKKICDLPRIYACDHFLSDEECDYLIALATPALERSTVIDPNSEERVVDPTRTSLGMFFSAEETDEVVLEIEERIAQVTHFPKERGENMQVLYYGVGAEYRPHYDFFDPSTLGGLSHYNRGGQRVATFMVYLNTPEKGGETVFPRARLKVLPKKGRALFFYNVDAMGLPDPKSLHGGAPVLQGEKWLITRWIRENSFY